MFISIVEEHYRLADDEFIHRAGLVVEEVAYRTPGFSGWQQERWWTHCREWRNCCGAMRMPGRATALNRVPLRTTPPWTRAVSLGSG